MRAGNLRHRITIQEPVTQRDTYGSETVTWVDKGSVWASVEPVSGREYFASKQINAEITVRVTLRYTHGIKPVMRIKFGGRCLEIVSVINTGERNRELQLMCREAV